MLLPHSQEEIIAQAHPVRTVNDIIEKIKDKSNPSHLAARTSITTKRRTAITALMGQQIQHVGE